MDYEELKADKMEQMKMDTHEGIANEKRMHEDSDYARDCILEANAEDIDKAKKLLDKAVTELFEAGLDIKDWQILKEYV